MRCLFSLAIDSDSVAVDASISDVVAGSCPLAIAGRKDDAVDVYGLNVYSWCDEVRESESVRLRR